MSSPKLPSQNAVLLGCALSVAPAAVGCALGMLIGERLGKRTREHTAVTLLAVGVVSAMPYVVDYVAKRINGPATVRGQRKRHEVIRDGALPAECEVYQLGEMVG